jgi:hypothetical protein
MNQVIHGTVRGKTIELSRALGIADGQEVELTLRIFPGDESAQPFGEGLRRSAGPLPDDSERDDELLAQIQAMRQSATSREVAE